MNGRGTIAPPPAPENFSYAGISADKVIEVPINQQMLVFDEVQIDGELELDGDIIVLEPVNITGI